MFQFLGRISTQHPAKILGAWVVLAIILTRMAPNWNEQAQDDDIRFLPADYPSVRAHRLLEQAFPKDVSACKVIIAIERPEGTLQPDDFALVDRLVTRIRQLRNDHPNLPITGVTSYVDGILGKRMVADDGQCTLIQVSLATPYLALQTRDACDQTEAALRPLLANLNDPPAMYFTGPAGIGRDLTAASAQSLSHTTWATVILVIIVLLLVYRSPLLALIPLVTIGLAVWVALQLLALATLLPGVQLVNVSQVFCIVILFGAGTDYCLFLISRYREELESGQEPAAGVQRSVRAVGGALTASAATVVCGLGMMGFADFGKIRCAGPVIALGLVVGLMAALTLTPALLAIGRRTAFWPQVIRRDASSPSHFWETLSHRVVRKPGMFVILSLVPLVGLALVGLRVSTTFRPTGDLSPDSGSIRGLSVLQEHFTAGETGPLTVLLAARGDWNSAAGQEAIAQFSQGFLYLPNVAEVRSLTQPLGQPLDSKQMGDRVMQAAALPHFLARIKDDRGPLFVTRIDVVMKSDPFEKSSIETLQLIETWTSDYRPIQTAELGIERVETFGVTVHGRDLGKAVARDRVRVNLLVALGVFLILLVLVRQIWLAGFLLATVLLSYFATLGLTALFAMWLTGRPFGEIEWRVPFFLFTILVAVGEDYNILLVARIMQERERHGMIEGLRRGLAATGGTITACGVIMAGTFGTLMLADLSTLKQIGFALAAGVLIDTFVVRPLLVPAFILIVWRDGMTAEQRKAEPSFRQAA